MRLDCQISLKSPPPKRTGWIRPWFKWCVFRFANTCKRKWLSRILFALSWGRLGNHCVVSFSRLAVLFHYDFVCVHSQLIKFRCEIRSFYSVATAKFLASHSCLWYRNAFTFHLNILKKNNPKKTSFFRACNVQWRQLFFCHASAQQMQSVKSYTVQRARPCSYND